MAHFARIKNNIVDEIIVISNEVITDENGQEQEQLGIDFCKSLYGSDTEWIQVSYNGNFRGSYPLPGMTYNSETDEFELPDPEIVEG